MRIAIIGAGITGLSLAYFLKKSHPDIEIKIFEKDKRAGGWIQTRFIDGDPFECGPRSFRIGKRSAPFLELLQALGLEDEIVIASQQAQKKYLAVNGVLQQSPRSFLSLITSSLGRIALRGMRHDFFASASDASDESVDSFFTRRFGKECVDSFIDPLIAGIYASDPAMLSIRSSFPDLFEYEKQYGSVIIGSFLQALKKNKMKHPLQGAICSCKNGMETIIHALLEHVKEALYLETEVSAIQLTGQNVEVTTSKSQELFDYVYVTTSYQLVDHIVPIPIVPAASVVTISLGYRDAQLQHEGFGFLASSLQERELLGVVFDSSVFPDQASSYRTKLSVMMGGHRAPDVIGYSEELLLEKALKYCSKYLHIRDTPEVHFVTRAPHAIACYPVNHYQTLQNIEDRLQKIPLALGGAQLYGVSLSDCVARAHSLSHMMTPPN